MTQEDDAFKENTAKSNAYWFANQRQNASSVCLKYNFEMVQEDPDGHTIFSRRTDSAQIEVHPDASWEYRSADVQTSGPNPNILKYFLFNPALYLESMNGGA